MITLAVWPVQLCPKAPSPVADAGWLLGSNLTVLKMLTNKVLIFIQDLATCVFAAWAESGSNIHQKKIVCRFFLIIHSCNYWTGIICRRSTLKTGQNPRLAWLRESLYLAYLCYAFFLSRLC